MHVMARPAISAAKTKHRDAADWLDAWWVMANKARWTKLDEVRSDYPATDQVGGCLVFDVKGNTYRLICGVVYAGMCRGRLYVKHFLTHAEYDKEKWKDDCK